MPDMTGSPSNAMGAWIEGVCVGGGLDGYNHV